MAHSDSCMAEIRNIFAWHTESLKIVIESPSIAYRLQMSKGEKDEACEDEVEHVLGRIFGRKRGRRQIYHNK